MVRFAVQNDQLEIVRAEVFDLAGKRLWAMTTEAGERVAHGVYLYVITAWGSQGELLKSQMGKLTQAKELCLVIYLNS